MSFEIFKKEDQAYGQFNGGAILENKPIGFPQDNNVVKPYSNIFYWAHAWTLSEDSLIGEHPHQGFEILSFVLSGSLKHYDTKLKEWQPLNEGDIQIIRAGSGISHAEHVSGESSFFQIWFDPDLSTSMQQPASYDNYSSGVFREEENNGVKVKNYTNNGSPLKMYTKGVEIYEIMIENDSYDLSLNTSKMRSFYVLEGSLLANENALEQHDFVRFQDEEKLQLSTKTKARIFVVDLLKDPGYTTYAQHNRLS